MPAGRVGKSAGNARIRSGRTPARVLARGDHDSPAHSSKACDSRKACHPGASERGEGPIRAADQNACPQRAGPLGGPFPCRHALALRSPSHRGGRGAAGGVRRRTIRDDQEACHRGAVSPGCPRTRRPTARKPVTLEHRSVGGVLVRVADQNACPHRACPPGGLSPAATPWPCDPYGTGAAAGDDQGACHRGAVCHHVTCPLGCPRTRRPTARKPVTLEQRSVAGVPVRVDDQNACPHRAGGNELTQSGLPAFRQDYPGRATGMPGRMRRRSEGRRGSAALRMPHCGCLQRGTESVTTPFTITPTHRVVYSNGSPS